jgi:hypothetical protein
LTERRIRRRLSVVRARRPSPARRGAHPRRRRANDPASFVLLDTGDATHCSGTWNRGLGVEHAPGGQGWECYLALESAGAGNYEARVYSPLNRNGV